MLRENPSKFKAIRHPVEQVICEEAIEFCARLSDLPAEKQAGRIYRLPTEVEWKHACRAGTTTAYSCGNDQGQLSKYGWHKVNAGDAHRPVGLKKPNPWGLHDMQGNVFEWVFDTYVRYSAKAVTDPKMLSLDGRPLSRGEDWSSLATYARSARRHAMVVNHRSSAIGFRVVCTIKK